MLVKQIDHRPTVYRSNEGGIKRGKERRERKEKGKMDKGGKG